MAVLWQKKYDNQHYEVRTAGNSRRLYKNGVCHSQFNPDSIITGSIWDLLILPVCYQPEITLQRVLVLGVGGGAVIRQLNGLFRPVSITGIEKDPLHLEIGRRYFGLDLENLDLVESDAVTWIEKNKSRKFDLIIEDIFTESSRRPVRSISAGKNWLNSLVKLLTRHGILVMNFASGDEFRESVVYRDMNVRNYFGSIYQLSTPTLDNRVIAMHKHPVLHTAIHRNITAIPELERAILSRKLKYRIRKVRQLRNF